MAALGQYHPYMDTLRVKILLIATSAPPSDEWDEFARAAIDGWPGSRQKLSLETV
jgi:hypothetical protein